MRKTRILPYMTIKEYAKVYGLSYPKLLARRSDKDFPGSYQINGGRDDGYRESDITDFLKDRNLDQ